MRVDKEFVLREIAGDYIIIPTGKTVLEFNGLITVNEVGVSIWNMLQKEVTFDKLVQGILDEYDVEEQVAREDIFYDGFVDYNGNGRPDWDDEGVIVWLEPRGWTVNGHATKNLNMNEWEKAKS